VTVQKRPTILFDFDDTLSDPIPFFLQFAREIGAYLSPRFGKKPEAWEKAAADMLIAVQEDYWERFGGNPTNGYLDWLHSLRRRSLQWMFDAVELPLPPDVERLARELQFEALSRCHAGFLGAGEAVAALHRAGYPLHMASGQESDYLCGGLTGLVLTPYFGRLFGPDLIDCAKEGPEYYHRVFAALGVQGEDVIVVDDYPPAIGWAVSTGAQVIQAQLSPVIREPVQPGIVATLTDLHDLPALIAQIAERR
jgi:phosphoglycolate phosphatase-like HAD superfamily hydrolase